MKPTETLDLDAIQARAATATAGPWSAYGTGVSGGDHWTVCNTVTAIASIAANDGINEEQREPDAEFIAHAREDIPTLLRVNCDLGATLRELEDTLDQARQLHFRTGAHRCSECEAPWPCDTWVVLAGGSL